MAGAPRYKLYHGSTYIGSFKFSDDAEIFCEAMQKAGKIIGELTIRDGHTKSDIELTYKQNRSSPTPEGSECEADKLELEHDKLRLSYAQAAKGLTSAVACVVVLQKMIHERSIIGGDLGQAEQAVSNYFIAIEGELEPELEKFIADPTP